MEFDDLEATEKPAELKITNKRSLGSLRKAAKTKSRSPDLIGEMKLQRHTFDALARQFERTDESEIACNLAAWRNTDYRGPLLTVEISPKYVARESRQSPKSNLAFIFEDEE